MEFKCECCDLGCPRHKGSSKCAGFGSTILYRRDMDDETGTVFCDPCAEDANESGVFTIEAWGREYDEEAE